MAFLSANHCGIESISFVFSLHMNKVCIFSVVMWIQFCQEESSGKLKNSYRSLFSLTSTSSDLRGFALGDILVLHIALAL